MKPLNYKTTEAIRQLAKFGICDYKCQECDFNPDKIAGVNTGSIRAIVCIPQQARRVLNILNPLVIAPEVPYGPV